MERNLLISRPDNRTYVDGNGNFRPAFHIIERDSYTPIEDGYQDTVFVREIVEVGTATGWDRREVYVDARDLDATDALIARGGEKLAEVGETTTLEVEYIPTPTYRYMTDFDLGDIVSAEYPGVATMQARIVAVTEQYPSGKIVLGLGKEWPDLISLVRALRKENAEMRR